MIKHNEGGGEGERGHSSEETALEAHVAGLREGRGLEKMDKNLQERLKMDWDNPVMDYNRMNSLEVFLAFKCDTHHSTTHWRVAKIMEGITVCSDQLKIVDPISPTSVPKDIYEPLEEGKVNEKNIQVRLKNPDNEENVPAVRASLSDFAHFVDLIKTNRELGSYKFDMYRLAFNYFTGRDLKRIVKTKKEGEKVIDILSDDINPRDDYKDLDVKGYLEFMKKDEVQAGLQLLAEWRYESDGHREMAGQAVEIQTGSSPADALFIPLCGRMASRITMSDLLKQDKSGMMGQPQEVAECEEKTTGAFIYFSLQDLAQRRRGGDIRNITKSQRMSKAMCGLTLNEEAYGQIETTVDEKTRKEKKIVYLCGKKLDGNIITSMKTRYNESMKRVRGFGLKDPEAADMVVTDVFIPCILNNPNDWLTAISVAYGVGGNKGAQSLLQNREVFQGFELRIMCRNMDKPPDYPIEWKTFKGFLEVQDYIEKRIGAGHIDQPEARGFARRSSKDLTDAKEEQEINEYFLGTITDLQGKNIYRVFEAIFGNDTKEVVEKYIKEGVSASLDKYPGKKQKKKGRKPSYDLDNVLGGEVENKLKNEEKGVALQEAIRDLYELRETDEIDDEVYLKDGFMQTLQTLSDKERAKIHP